MKINAYLLIDSHGAIEVRKKPPAPGRGSIVDRD